MSIEYVRDGGGELIEYGQAIAAIISGGGKWLPAASARLTRQEAAYYGRALRGALATCTKAQMQIVRLLAVGYSQAQIAARTGRDVRTVKANIAKVRAKIADYINTHAPRLAAVVDVDAAADAAARAGNRRTAAGADAKRKSDMATNAERCRAYRARKAAARAAAKAALDAAAADAADAAAADARRKAALDETRAAAAAVDAAADAAVRRAADAARAD